MPIPIISVSNPLALPGNHYTTVACDLAYEQIVEHLIKKHNKTKIAFMNASLTHSPESEERENAFRAAMKKSGLEVNEDWIYAGDFTPKTAYDCFKERFKKGDKLPFEAILCANDYMAAGCVSIFSELGITIPGDVIVFGFDNAEVATNCDPMLSTISPAAVFLKRLRIRAILMLMVNCVSPLLCRCLDSSSLVTVSMIWQQSSICLQ